MMKFRCSCFVEMKDLASFVELMAPYGQVIVHPVDGPQSIVSKPQTLLRTVVHRRSAGLGSRGGARTGPVIAVQAAVNMTGVTAQQLKEIYVKNRLAPNGAGASLSKLAKRGYLRNEHGVWKPTPKGEALAKRWATETAKATNEHSD